MTYPHIARRGAASTLRNTSHSRGQQISRKSNIRRHSRRGNSFFPLERLAFLPDHMDPDFQFEAFPSTVGGVNRCLKCEGEASSLPLAARFR